MRLSWTDKNIKYFSKPIPTAKRTYKAEWIVLAILIIATIIKFG